MSTIGFLLEVFLSLQGQLVGDLELVVRGIGGELDSIHLLNNVHDVGSIGEMLHNILTSLSDPVPNVLTDGELSEMLTKAIKNHQRIITKKGRVTTLWIENLMKDVV